MLKSLLAVLAAIAGLIPGALLGLQITPYIAPALCPPPDGPNLCAFALGLVSIAVCAIIGSLIFGYVAARLLGTRTPNIVARAMRDSD
jgi:hypothetical protein